jgi:hypothetical protein
MTWQEAEELADLERDGTTNRAERAHCWRVVFVLAVLMWIIVGGVASAAWNLLGWTLL